MGQTVGIPHPHPGQLHQTAHFGVRKLLPEREARDVPADHRLLCGPAGVEGTDGILSRLQARDRRERRRTFLRCRRLFRLFRCSLRRRLRSLPAALVGPHGAGGDGLLGLCVAEGGGGGSAFTALCKHLQCDSTPRVAVPSVHFAPWAALMSC